MNVESTPPRLSEYFSWPYHGQWGGWALVVIATMALALLILAARAQAKSLD